MMMKKNENENIISAKISLVKYISKIIREKKITQTKVGELFGISQPKVSDLLKNILRGYSIDRLLFFLNKLDCDIYILIRPVNRDAIIRVYEHDEI